MSAQCEIVPERSALYRYKHGCRCNACRRAHSENTKGWRDRNREYVEATNRERRKKYERVTDSARTFRCERCGESFVVAAGCHARRTCDDCKNAVQRAHDARKRAGRRERRALT